MMELTQAQRDAIFTHDRNLMVVAGAGSGKTSVLVRRYLALLDANPDWSLNALVAITFTHKAAQEMRDRVRQALESRLAEAGGEDEATLWAERLGAMDSARIDTIHALCASILRANAAEAGIDPAFAVLDEMDARILLDNVMDDALRRMAAEDDPAVRLFAEYDGSAIRRTVVEFIGVELPDPPHDLLMTWQERWQSDAEAQIRALAQNPAFIELAAWQPAGGVPGGEDRLLHVWLNCRDALETLFQDSGFEARLDALRWLAREIKINVGSAAFWGGKAALEDAKAALGRIRALAQETLDVIGEPPGVLDARAAELLPLWVALVRRVQAAYRQTKAAESALDFDDLEARTRALLHDNPEVRARYRHNEFKHLLVDEFQDTNAAQWEIVQALADLHQPGSLFLVGDAKQSIYAFRGADVSVFEQVRGQLQRIGGMEIPLTRSFRTHQGLVNCFNRLFERVLTRDEAHLARDYQIALGEPMDAARLEAPCDAPALEVVLIEKQRGGEWAAEDYRRVEARELARRIRALVEGKQTVYVKGTGEIRPANYGDVAVLFQSMTSITLYEDIFKAEGLPFVTVAGRGYYDRQEVWDLINLLTALYNPADDLALASALRSPLFNLSDDALLGLRLVAGTDGKPLPLWSALWQAAQEPVTGIGEDEQPLIIFAFETLSDLRRLAGRVTITELLREALNRTGYLATLAGLPDGARRRGNLEKLLEKAQASGKTTLGAFSHYLRDLTAVEAREGEALLEVSGAVTLMTVHKSKGLEFPVIVLADLSWKRGSADGGLLAYDLRDGLACRVFNDETSRSESPYAFRRFERLRQLREEAERRRLLYVAATRAQDYLIVSGQVRHSDERGWSADGCLDWILDAFELRDIERQDSQLLDYDWGQMRVSFPAVTAFYAGERREAPAAWDAELIPREAAPGDAGEPSPLLGTARVERDAPARSLKASQVEDLGSIGVPGDGMLYRRRLRRNLLHDAPAYIPAVSARYAGGVPEQIVAEVVRRALRWWRFPTPGDDLTALLTGYAWEQGIVDAARQREAVRRARDGLLAFRRSDLYDWIESAEWVSRDIPVVYDTGRRTIHGVIDMLVKHRDGGWAVIDYKTARVQAGDDLAALAEHARRYHLQMGVYARAVQEQLQELSGHAIVPDVFIHYIRHAATIPVATSEWQEALEHLEERIGELLG